MRRKQEYDKKYCEKMINFFIKKKIKFKLYKSDEEIPKDWTYIMKVDNGNYIKIHNYKFCKRSRRAHQTIAAYLNPKIPINIVDAFGENYEYPDDIMIVCEGSIGEKINKILKIN